MESNKDLKIIISDAINSKNISVEQLAEITGIPERYILAIQNTDLKKLPSKPYIGGYLKKISGVLGLNYEEMWKLYKKELEEKTSGEYDKLPENRFAIKHVSREKKLAVVFGVVLVLYIIFNLSRILGNPVISISNPNTPVVLFSSPINLYIITGTAEPKDKLTINGEEIAINTDGTFSKELKLLPGENNLEFKIKKFLGREKTIIRKVQYQPINNY